MTGPRRFTGDSLVIATHNPGKVPEIAALFAPYGVREFLTCADLGLPEPVEDGDTFIANAEIKSRAAARESGRIAIADDSGLVVPALGGAPGIYSARWAGPQKDFRIAMARVENEMRGQADNRAHFVSALSLCWPDGHCETVEGYVHGHLTFPPRGSRGFGYDPIFIPQGHAMTFAEMEPAHKHAMSHRADAFRKLLARCFAP